MLRHTNESSEKHRAFLNALNNAAAELQRSAHTEADVFAVFNTELKKLDIYASISVYDASHHEFIIKTVSMPTSFSRHLEKLANNKIIGYHFSAEIPPFSDICQNLQTVYLPDNFTLVGNMVPSAIKHLTPALLKLIGKRPVIIAPIIINKAIYGAITIDNPTLTEADIPAITAFANHLSATLENANLIERLHTEIEHHKETTAQLSANQTLYRVLIESAPVAIIIHVDDTFAYLNPAAVKLFGAESAQDLLGKSLYEFTEPSRIAETRQRVNTLYKSKRSVGHIENQLLKLDKTPITVELVSSPITYEGKPGALVILQDITHRKAAEKEQRKHEERYRALFEQSHDAIFLENEDDEIIDVNPRASEMLGYTREELLSMRVPDLQAPELRGEYRKTVSNELGDKQYITFERKDLHKDGSLVPIELSLSRLTASDEKLVLAVARDISERKKTLTKLEERLAQLTLLNDVSYEIAGMLKLSDVFDRTVALIHDKFGYHHVALFIRDNEKEAMVMMARAGAYAALLPPRHTLKFTEGMVGWVARNKQTLVANDVSAESVHHNPMPEHPQMVTRAELSIPIIVDDMVEAILDIQSPELNAFSKHQIMVMETLAQQISAAIKNARYLETIERDLEERRQTAATLHQQNQELTLLNQIIAITASSGNLPLALETICQKLSAAIGTSWSRVVTVDVDDQTATILASYSSHPQDNNIAPPGLTFPLSREHLDTIRSNPSLAIEDVSQSSAFAELLPWDKLESLQASVLHVPIYTSGKFIGLLATGTRDSHHFAETDIALAQRVADQLSGVMMRIELEKTRQRLSMAVEQSNDAVVIIATDGLIVYVNRGFERMFGYKSDEVLHTIPTSLAPEQELEPINVAVENEERWHGPIKYYHKDGSIINTETVIMPIHDTENRVINFIITAQDITQRMELEEQLRQSQKMEAVGQLAAGIAHDFNNMLTAINGFAELLLEKTAFDSIQHEYVLQILESGSRAADLVRQLLAFSRKQLIAPKILNLNQTIIDVQQMLRRVIGEHISINTNLAKNIYPVKLDPAQIEQILVNLAVNSQDAMPQGGTLTIETANVHLSPEFTDRIPELPTGEYVMLTVSDTGEGIPDEILAHIFEPFFTTKDVGKGTGLGLATIYGIVKQNSGHIEVHSEQNVGTTFFIYLPRTYDVPHAPLMETGKGLPAGSGTIMVVEDSEFVLDFTTTVLTELGYKVISALDTQSALHEFDRLDSPPNLLLTDIVLPGRDGVYLATAVKKQYPDIKVLFMSGYNEIELHKNLSSQNGAAYLNKPFSAADLAQTVQKLLLEQ